jgi:hypothetical protein
MHWSATVQAMGYLSLALIGRTLLPFPVSGLNVPNKKPPFFCKLCFNSTFTSNVSTKQGNARQPAARTMG